MRLEFRWSRLEAFSALEIHRIIKARESVFVVEQRCPYQETDDMDIHAWHLSVCLKGELAAYARVVDPGIKYHQPSIGRVMTLKNFRKMRIGHQLMEEAIRFTEQKFPNRGIKIGAQVHLQKFYGSFGFQPVGEPYDDDGIPHLDMVRESISAA
ncbi:GNAT family N-acetyltransferase [Stenotrophomonas sp. NLF4-10]|uniref:GNAT family N-acetyltransferase n=1 Tax=Stenotrophomonas sp. NLF4-10 TaxID=2918754 RepID=UPI001EFA723B|nr:GNAT family N-acetyltransferase [Stenotrophomonas sp. NLF4-10]MCG8275983.1 GNAT family N-acetyltransferase [Stenotrophomonas sp. NLF4-10]